MAARPSWQGHLRLSLVTCPVALYPATSEADTVRFNLINPETNNRIKMKTVDAGTGDEVSRSDLVKGFAIAKNQYVLLDKEDFESVKLESTRIIDIESSYLQPRLIGSTGTRLITWCPLAKPASKPSP
jgi:DNA end-binding protein Ku